MGAATLSGGARPGRTPTLDLPGQEAASFLLLYICSHVHDALPLLFPLPALILFVARLCYFSSYFLRLFFVNCALNTCMSHLLWRPFGLRVFFCFVPWGARTPIKQSPRMGVLPAPSARMHAAPR